MHCHWKILIFLATLFVSLSGKPVHAQSGTLANPFTSMADAYTVPQSGRYVFAVGGSTFEADVDTSEGGGWVLVLQYIHQAPTNPALSVIGAGSNLPVTSLASLGADESGNPARWGHASNAAVSQFSGDIETRWYGQTSRDPGDIIHFYSTVGDSYFKTGSGSVVGITSDHTLLTGHTASIPAAVANYYDNQGNFALTNFPYWLAGTYHWGIRGLGNRWEVDDYSLNIYNTIHRVWMREKPVPVTVPDPTEVCRASFGSQSGNPNFYWDSEPHGAPGGYRSPLPTPDYITAPSNTTQGLGVVTSNSAPNALDLNNIEATNLDEARRNKEYLEQSFTMSSNHAMYVDGISVWTLQTDGFGIDLATQSDFSDAVNLWDAAGNDLAPGWTRFAPKARFLLKPGKTYYWRMYFYGQSATNRLLDGWGFSVRSCMDFGDAPIEAAAFHVQTGSLQLGGIAGDQEDENLLANGLGDNSNGGDDEDGITLPTFRQAQTIPLTANVTGSGFLQAWIDFDGDGSFADAGEQVAIDLQDNAAGDTNAAAGTISFDVAVPANATVDPTYARFRWSSDSGLSSSGIANDGEIEDYPLSILGEVKLQITKTSAVWDQSNLGNFFIPGQELISTITVSIAQGDGPDPNTVVLIDALPPEITFYNGDMDAGGPASDPVHFIDNGSGLTFTYSTDVAYSDSASAPTNFGDCGYTPALGYDPVVTFICINPKGVINSGDPAPYAEFQFRSMLE